MPAADMFYLSQNIPEVFRIADRRMEELHPRPQYVKKPYEVPVPMIDSNPNVDGPLHITKGWYEKEKIKKKKARDKQKRDCELEMIQLLAMRDHLRHKLGSLNPGKKRDAKEIAAINVKLRDIQTQLSCLETESGIHIDELDHGTRVSRFIGRMKRGCKKAVKKVKRFCKRHADLFATIGAIIAPFLGSLLCKFLI